MEEISDYYELLGIGPRADATEIKVAFKRMALKYHPDVYSGPDAEERMRLLLTAYKTLSNPSTRKTYDLTHGISRRGMLDDEESLAFYRSANGRSFTTSSGRIPTPDKAASAGNPPRSAAAPSETPLHVTSSKAPVTFPRLDVGAGAVIALEGFVYTLTAPQAARLREDGRLLGSDMPQRLPSINGTAGRRRCTCHRCGQSWIVPPDHHRTSTERCPTCAAPDWAEYLLLRCHECTAVFESRRIRRYDQVKIGERYYGDYHLCQPYELFPQCPNCQAIRWCAGEEMRLNHRSPQGQTRTSGPLFQGTGPHPTVSGGFTRPADHLRAYSPIRSSGSHSPSVPRTLFTLAFALLIAGSLFAIYAFILATR